jgi:hypothetical protein
MRLSFLLLGKTNCEPIPTLEPGYTEKYPNYKAPYVMGFAFAPYVSSDGTWAEPFTSTTTSSKANSNKSPSGTTTTTSKTSSTYTETTTTTSKGTIITTTKKTSTSALRAGADFQLNVSTYDLRPLDESFFYATPFYQTDFGGQAQIYGLDATWEPLSHDFYLGDGPTHDYYRFFWQFKGEVELTDVNNAGYTDFNTGRHAFFGETARVNFELFPSQFSG